MTTLHIEYPDTLPDRLSVSRQQFEQEAKMALAVKLFEAKRISSGDAATIAGVERVDFIMRLRDFGVAALDQDPDELESDVENA